MNWFEKLIDGIVGAVGSIFGGMGGGESDQPEFTKPDYDGPVDRAVDDAIDSVRDRRNDDDDFDSSWLSDARESGTNDGFLSWASDNSVIDPGSWDDATITLRGDGGVTVDYVVDGENYSADYDNISGFFDDIYDVLYDEYEVDFDIDDEYSEA